MNDDAATVWERDRSRVPVGHLTRGTITESRAFGAFVDLGDSVVGLIEAPDFPSRASWEDRSRLIGVVVDAVVVQVDDERRQIRLSLRPMDVARATGRPVIE